MKMLLSEEEHNHERTIASVPIKGLHGFRNFEKSIFFIIFYITVQHVMNIFPNFQVNRNKIPEERLFKSSPVRIPMGRLLF